MSKIRGETTTLVGMICPPIGIGLTDLPKSGGAILPPPSSGGPVPVVLKLSTCYRAT
jgi:hypothetical protein